MLYLRKKIRSLKKQLKVNLKARYYAFRVTFNFNKGFMNKKTEVLIDCDTQVYVPHGLEVIQDADQLPNRVRGQVSFSSTRVKLHLVNGQKDGWSLEDVRRDLIGERVYTAHILDYLLENKHLIPVEWKDKGVFFWGTIYYRRKFGEFCVRYLSWEREVGEPSATWLWAYHTFPNGGCSLDANCPAAIAQ
jgi:hypothetical protein